MKVNGAGFEVSAKLLALLRKTLNNVTLYNQNPSSALEELTRSIMELNFLNDGIMRSCANE